MEFCVSSLWINLVIFVAGCAVLVRGSDLFVDAAAGMARKLNVSELAIGLTVVSIGTSLPELATSMYAATQGSGDFIIGNIIGSNVTNIALILGAGVVAGGALEFDRNLLRRDIPLMDLLFLLIPLMLFAVRVPAPAGAVAPPMVPAITEPGAALLLLGAIVYCIVLFRHSPPRVNNEIKAAEEAGKSAEATRSLLFYCGMLALGFVMVVGGAKAMVDPVVWAARQLKIDPMLISVTVVAFGTSVPDLAVTVAGVLKKKHDIAVGNIVGSCIFNILLVIGACGVLAPIRMLSSSGMTNAWLMLPTGLLLTGFMVFGRKLVRWQGAVLLLLYCGFLAYNIAGVLN